MALLINARGRVARGSALAVALGTMLLGACDEQIALGERVKDPSDPCMQYREVIVEARDTDIRQQQQAAMTGAIFGAILGGVLSSDDDRMQGILAGAAVGGLTGLSATYYNQKTQRAADSQALLASVNSDATAEGQLVTRTGRAAKSLRTCRRNQVASLTEQVRAGSVERDAARAQLRNIQSQIDADNRLVSAAFNGINERVTAYSDAAQAVAQADNAISAQRAQAATPSVSQVATASSQIMTADQQDSQLVSSEIAALQVLLG